MSIPANLKKFFCVTAIIFSLIALLFLVAVFLRINVFNSTPF
jgi:hypothetical protein